MIISVNYGGYIMRILLIIAILLLPQFTAKATTYHVSKAGSDGNSGTSWAAAWLTIAKINDTSNFHTGDSVIFGDGIWRETIYIPRIDSDASNKTYYLDSAWVAGTEDRRVAWIYGSDSLHTWSLVSGEIYKCSYTPTFMDNHVGIWQGDSILLRQTSSSLSEGQSYYASNEVFAWIYGGGDPDTLSLPIEVGQRAFVVYTPELESGSGNLGYSSDNWVLQGLGFKYSHGHGITTNNTGRNELGYDSSLISHCYLACNMGDKDDNVSLIYTPRISESGEADPVGSGILDGADYNRIVACSIGQNFGVATTLPQLQNVGNSGGLNFYNLRFSVIDSNIFWGHLGNEGAIRFKSWMASDSGAVERDTIRFNTFHCESNAMINFLSAYKLSIYGNTFRNKKTGSTSWGIFTKPSVLGMAWAGGHEIYNNTFYDFNSTSLLSQSEDDPTIPTTNNKFKYNIVYNTTGEDVIRVDSASFWVDIDSNMYYTESGTNTFETNQTTWNNYSFAQWQSIVGFDVNSTDATDPGFTNAGSGDFSRTSASGEMNRVYGGKTWTIFGAIQNVPAEAATEPIEISGAVTIEGAVVINEIE